MGEKSTMDGGLTPVERTVVIIRGVVIVVSSVIGVVRL